MREIRAVQDGGRNLVVESLCDCNLAKMQRNQRNEISNAAEHAGPVSNIGKVWAIREARRTIDRWLKIDKNKMIKAF